jgi:hypothetical protein
VDRAQALLHRRDGLLDAALIGDVALQRQTVRRRLGLAQIERRDARAFGGETARRRAPEPARGAGDDRDAAFQLASPGSDGASPFDRYRARWPRWQITSSGTCRCSFSSAFWRC